MHNKYQAYVQSNKITFIAIAAEMGEPDFVFPADLNTIESEAFAGVSASIIYIPDSVTSLGSKVFADCTELTQIRIPESVMQIPDDVFDGIDLAQITIFGTPGSAAELFASSAGIQFEIE